MSRAHGHRGRRITFDNPYTSFGDATYRAPRVGIFSPADLRADADTLHGQVLALDNALSAHGGQVSDTGVAFLNFENEWNTFYANLGSGILGDFGAALDNGNRDQLVQFEDRFADLAGKLGAEGVTIVENIIKPVGTTPSLLGNMFAGMSAEAVSITKWVAILGGIGLGIYAVSKFAPLLKTKRNPRRRARRW